MWSALDCPGGFTTDVVKPIVLGRMTASISTRPPAGQECVIVGRLLAREGRKISAAVHMYDAVGRLLARARQTWFEIDPLLYEGHSE